ncbi:alanine--tRNA ligase, mitochondrial [Anopheles ziemanni]|uniref:alanine--tRNA ligase, mitochondrial n=1 Tax=Anopheles coustani TaxID=139045 RepID=UPI00265A3437|nr:alanine--tRNA ligase, mitochondrial [Anopheles coustani]XP_058167363.1 alanine--tRNA ligase, mitochondrial [Anopheles ziemanni]
MGFRLISVPKVFLRSRTLRKSSIHHVRHQSCSSAGPSSNEIRQQFIDYFTGKHNHRLLRSSSLIPYNDSTIAFVNAGMNQFKNIFLGAIDRPCPRVVNSQKCVRVGGKHNDLSVVGTDSYHHTFFEMLGNWSFGDYFKREACEMAWDLLRNVYRIDAGRIYVTYFGGDTKLNLPADDECREIWLSLGIPKDRILPFGARDNFWEMGNSGPCGPCTEIHLDLSNEYRHTEARRHLVNAGVPDLTEIWNIVFIQYNRSLIDGSINNLPQHHVDTGMGLERLVAHLQGKMSNYDTDLFNPVFQRIQKASKKNPYSGCFTSNESNYELDTAYRILADHSRMITACLADGMFPSQNHKLRRIIRKSLALANGAFQCPQLLKETIPAVVEILGDVYPEMRTNLPATLQIIDHEQQSYNQLRSKRSAETASLLKSFPMLEESEVLEHAGLPGAIKELVQTSPTVLTGQAIHKMFDTYGLDEELLVKLGEMLKFSLDFRDYDRYVRELKDGHKHELATKLQERLSAFQSIKQSLDEASLKPTRDERKYNYTFNQEKGVYDVAPCQTRVNLLLEDETNRLLHIVTEQSNFYCESGGQQGDIGRLVIQEGNAGETKCVDIASVSKHNGFIVHTVENKTNTPLAIGDRVVLQVDSNRRTLLTVHHTATHLLNAVVRKVVALPMCQRSSAVSEKGLRLELAISGDKITLDQVATIEAEVRAVINQNQPTSVNVCNANELDFGNITTVPGETYPDRGLRVVSVGNVSRELCCGTHAITTGELQDFAITNVTQSKSGCFTFHAVAGQAAKKVHYLGRQIQNDVEQLRQDAGQNERQEELTIIESRMQRLKNVLLTGMDNNIHLPYCVRQRCLEVINTLYQALKNRSRESLRELVDIEMRNLIEQKPPATDRYIVHFLECSIILDDVQLSKATRYCPDRPILVISITDNQIKARATVPRSMVSERFNAERWLTEVANTFKAQTAAPKGQNAAEVCNMKSRKVTKMDFESMLENALRAANKFAEGNFH